MSSTCSARVSAASSSCSSASGIGSATRRRAPGIRADCSPRTNTWRNSRPCAACMARTQTAPWRPSPAPSSLVVQAGLGDRRHVAGEVAPGRLRRAPHVGGGQVAEARERDEPLDDVGLRGEELLAAQPEAVDEPVHEEVGARGVQRARGRAVQLEEAEDALARLGRQLRRLGRGDQRADHVELAPARDLHAARDVDRRAARSAGARGRARRRPRRWDRRAGAARRARP